MIEASHHYYTDYFPIIAHPQVLYFLLYMQLCVCVRVCVITDRFLFMHIKGIFTAVADISGLRKVMSYHIPHQKPSCGCVCVCVQISRCTEVAYGSWRDL